MRGDYEVACVVPFLRVAFEFMACTFKERENGRNLGYDVSKI